MSSIWRASFVQFLKLHSFYLIHLLYVPHLLYFGIFCIYFKYLFTSFTLVNLHDFLTSCFKLRVVGVDVVDGHLHWHHLRCLLYLHCVTVCTSFKPVTLNPVQQELSFNNILCLWILFTWFIYVIYCIFFPVNVLYLLHLVHLFDLFCLTSISSAPSTLIQTIYFMYFFYSVYGVHFIHWLLCVLHLFCLLYLLHLL